MMRFSCDTRNIGQNVNHFTKHITTLSSNLNFKLHQAFKRYEGQGWISLTHLHSAPSSIALRQAFSPQKASQKLGNER